MGQAIDAELIVPVALGGRSTGIANCPALRLKNTVLVFARLPRLGTVKKRLAADIGARGAVQFHQATLVTLLHSLIRDRSFRTILAFSPDRGRWRLPIRVPVIRQGAGNLGQRMERAFRRFPRERVALVGSDIPALRARHVRTCFASLGSAQAVFGPATDGGYWLVAMGPRRPARPFAGVRWSTGHALADTLANFTNYRVCSLEVLQDIDTAVDFGPPPQNRLILVAHSRSGDR